MNLSLQKESLLLDVANPLFARLPQNKQCHILLSALGVEAGEEISIPADTPGVIYLISGWLAARFDLSREEYLTIICASKGYQGEELAEEVAITKAMLSKFVKDAEARLESLAFLDADNRKECLDLVVEEYLCFLDEWSGQPKEKADRFPDIIDVSSHLANKLEEKCKDLPDWLGNCEKMPAKIPKEDIERFFSICSWYQKVCQRRHRYVEEKAAKTAPLVKESNEYLLELELQAVAKDPLEAAAKMGRLQQTLELEYSKRYRPDRAANFTKITGFFLEFGEPPDKKAAAKLSLSPRTVDNWKAAHKEEPLRSLIFNHLR